MSARLANKAAFITGAARGQGRAHAVRMADEGADIIAVDIAGKLPPCVPYDSATPADLAGTVQLVEDTGQKILAAVVDVGRAGHHRGQRRCLGTPDVGRHHFRGLRDVIDINVTGAWNTVMAGAQKIIDGGRDGSIILISSAAGIKMQPFMVHYTANKRAATGMARAFASELGRHSIRVNSVRPGPVNTLMGSGDMIGSLGRAIDIYPQLAQMITPFLPTWAAEPENIADAVCWLASEESKNVTAAAISIDQGMTQY